MSVCATDLLAPVLTAHGHLLLVPDSDAPSLPAALQQRLSDAFALGSGHGPLHLGAAEVGSILRPAWARWRDYAARYVTALCATPEGGAIAASDEQALDRLIADAPPMAGVEYLTTEVLRKRAACPHGRAAVSARVDVCSLILPFLRACRPPASQNSMPACRAA